MAPFPITINLLVISFSIGLVSLSLLIIFLLLIFQFSESVYSGDIGFYLHFFLSFLCLLFLFLLIVIPLEYLAIMESSKVMTKFLHLLDSRKRIFYKNQCT